MSNPVWSPTDLVSLLDSTIEPVYVLDGERRIIYCNAACCQWVGAGAQQLRGVQCCYHSSGEVSQAEGLAAALCPPPEALGGKRASAIVSFPGADAALDARQVYFLPLIGPEGRPAGIIGWASSQLPDQDDPADDSSARLHAQIQHYRRKLGGRYRIDRLLGESPAIKRVRAQVALAAACDCSVLVVGPPGSGRQHVARAIHLGRGPEQAGPMVPLSCSLLSAELLQTTIRGLVRFEAGAACPQRLATLLLSDVEQMSAEARAELAGFMRLAKLPLRVISTARQRLTDSARDGGFGAELSCFLSTLVIELPPLSERLEDLPLLAQLFLEEINAGGAKQVGGFTPEALDRLTAYPWPGQVAELAQVVAQAHEQAEDHEVSPRDLPARIHLAADAARYPVRQVEPIVLEDFLEKIERELIARALARSKGNKTRAAKLLGMNRPRFYRRLVQLGLEEGDGK